MSIKESSSNQFTSSDSEVLSTDEVSIENQIAFITNFYPSPKFVKMVFDQTEASSNEQSVQDHYPADAQSCQSSQSDSQGCLEKVNESHEYEFSEIKAQNLGLMFNMNKKKEKDLRSVDQSEFEYRQLLDELSFQEKIEKVPFSSQKARNVQYEFELQDEDRSFVSEDNEHFQHFHKKEKNFKQKLVFQENQVENIKEKVEFIPQYKNKWDPSSELTFIRKNRLQRFIDIVNKHFIPLIENVIANIRAVGAIRNCQKCKRKLRRHERKRFCQCCRTKPKQGSKVKSSFISSCQDKL